MGENFYSAMWALFILFAGLCAAQPQEVTSLPGWEGPLPSRMFSGEIAIGTPPSGVGSMFMHYLFIEKEGEGAEDAPLLAWYNGGPGASSLYGLFVELGPLWLNDLSLQDPRFNATGVPQLVRNPYAWTKFANVLVVDSPPPVGFSYCSQYGPSGNGTSCGPWTDTDVFEANANFFVAWFKQFPSFQKNEFFMTGESYAGVYCPGILQALMKRPEAKNLNIVGIATGDGCLGTSVLCGGANFGLGGPYWDLVFFYGHGQLPIQFNTDILNTCTVAELKSTTQSPACAKMVQKMYEMVGGYYGYNLLDYCGESEFSNRKRNVHINDDSANPTYNFPGVGYPCPGVAYHIWINLPETRQALNVPADSYFFDADNGNGFVYNPNVDDVRGIYMEWLKNTSIRALIYNGDTDPSLSSFRTQDAWFPYLAQQGVKVSEEWRPWTVDNKTDTRGYVQEWENNRFSYLTIRGSGHMVPEFRPQAAFLFMKNFVEGVQYPYFNGHVMRK